MPVAFSVWEEEFANAYDYPPIPVFKKRHQKITSDHSDHDLSIQWVKFEFVPGRVKCKAEKLLGKSS